MSRSWEYNCSDNFLCYHTCGHSRCHVYYLVSNTDDSCCMRRRKDQESSHDHDILIYRCYRCWNGIWYSPSNYSSTVLILWKKFSSHFLLFRIHLLDICSVLMPMKLVLEKIQMVLFSRVQISLWCEFYQLYKAYSSSEYFPLLS